MVCVCLDSIARCFLSLQPGLFSCRRGRNWSKKRVGRAAHSPHPIRIYHHNVNGGEELVLEAASDQNEYLTPIWTRRIGQALSSRVALGWVTSTVDPP